jgi:Uma2 family endonuclease
MRSTVEMPKKVWTQAEMQALPEQGFNHEVVDGELVMSPKNDFFHGFISARLSAALLSFVQAKRLGAVLDSSTGFWMKNHNCRAPDISFISRARLEALGFRPSSRLFFPGAPDLAVEVLSPNNTRNEIDERLSDFFASGSRLVWIIDPQNQRVEVCRSLTDRRFIDSGSFLEGENILTGFRYPISNLFKEWDWE